MMATVKPWPFVPMLAVAALAASAYWWQSEKDRWIAPAPRKPDLPKVEPIAPPAPILAKQAVERPLLWTSRRPVLVDEQKSNLVSELMQSRLMAVLESGKDRVAILQRADGSPLKITTETKPWRLESFDGRKAVFLTDDGQRAERPLEAGSAPPARGQSAVDRSRALFPNK